ncbi:MAG: hypothetical protein DRH56_06545 [Deltaproteobacteria bacterium]|nr:MAG: hypothetical protein DRH56_06545 [Deltaproteobacteria bacterium]
MNRAGPLLSSPIGEKIAWAEDRWQRFGERLLRDGGLADSLRELETLAAASRRTMAAAGIVSLCAACELEEGGSCCGAGMENHYDGWLLLINLLMGVRFPGKRADPGSCFFLGKTGCVLKVRHVICVNYLCRKISDRIDPEKLAELREKEGEELTALFRFHERLKQCMGRGSPRRPGGSNVASPDVENPACGSRVK